MSPNLCVLKTELVTVFLLIRSVKPTLKQSVFLAF